MTGESLPFPLLKLLWIMGELRIRRGSAIRVSAENFSLFAPFSEKKEGSLVSSKFPLTSCFYCLKMALGREDYFC